MKCLLSSILGKKEHDVFLENYYRKAPYAAPQVASSLNEMFSWKMAQEILDRHDNCWIVQKGALVSEKAQGRVDQQEFTEAFNRGMSLVIRHGERSHPDLRKLAADFRVKFQKDIDIQLYVTPSGQEGFDWHYDLEDVFVFQTKGSKEFALKQKRPGVPPYSELPKSFKLEDYTQGPEMRCLLKAGDFLYIPAGYWHKAHALETSFHISVGVMNADTTSPV